MINRYSRNIMREIWSDKSKFDAMLKVEILASKAFYELGKVPEDEFSLIEKNASFDIDRIYEIEKETKHDVVAFTQAVSETLGSERRWIHYGLTSTDVVDTANAIVIKNANEVIFEGMIKLQGVLKMLADKYKMTPCIGRTHGVHADITSFGLKWALYYDEMNRMLKRFENVIKEIEVGKISGAVGNFSNAPAFVQDFVCKELGIGSANISTQVLQRDRHSNYIFTLSLIGSLLEKIALEVRHLQRTEVREVEEFFSDKQKGSSAMPHKRNPISSENICGCARVLRGYAVTAMENTALWHERDISHSSAERIILCDATTLLDYMLNRYANVLSNLVVFENRMEKNIFLTNGVIFAQRFLNVLVEKGLTREESYKLIQPLSFEVWNNNLDFKTVILNSDVKEYMTEEEIESCFDLQYFLRSVDEIYDRVFN